MFSPRSGFQIQTPDNACFDPTAVSSRGAVRGTAPALMHVVGRKIQTVFYSFTEFHI